MKKVVLFSIIIYLVFTKSMTASNRVYIYKENTQLTSCWLTFQEKYYELNIRDDSTFKLLISEGMNERKNDTFIYSGIWHKQHDTLYLFKHKTKHIINGINASSITLHSGCSQIIIPNLGPWSSINLLFIDKISYIQKIVFPLLNKDYWSKTYNANTITKERLNLTFQIFPDNR